MSPVPWHQWKFHRLTGLGEKGYEADCIPCYPVRVEAGRVLIDIAHPTRRNHLPHEPHPLARPVVRAPGPIRVLGLSTTIMDLKAPRYSGSEHLLTSALAQAASEGRETRMIRLNELSFEACKGYYSKSAHACTWPCSITQMRPKDQMAEVYEALVHWADVVLVATPIRWGQASSLYFKMAERLNTVQNAITLHDQVLIRNKVAGFLIAGGQDNVQGVAGQMLSFFAELGFLFPQFPFVAHTRGWTAEDMENNIIALRDNAGLHAEAGALASRAAELADGLIRLADPAPATVA